MKADQLRFQCIILRARTQYLCKKGQECLWASLCNCVSLQCPIPVIMAAGTIFSQLFFSWPGVCLHLAKVGVVKNGFYDKQLLYSAAS